MSEDYGDMGDFALIFAAVEERLRRLEEHLGITEKTGAQAELYRRYEEDQ